jgi:non-ribosomal peptide synthetase component E (peptide arylation enzyme)
VKVRGVRVEPDEVEKALMLDPAVRTAAVVVSAGTPGGDVRLVAHVVPEPDSDSDAMRLRSRLTGLLPEQMMPASFVLHAGLPVSTSGKIDREALEGWESAPIAGGGDRIAPTPLERELGTLWATVLETPEVAPHDDFFALGGHSLLGIKLLGRVAEQTGVVLPLRSIFEEPTLAGMASLIEEQRDAH